MGDVFAGSYGMTFIPRSPKSGAAARRCLSLELGRAHRASRSSEMIWVESVPPLKAPVAIMASYSGKSLRLAHFDWPLVVGDDCSSAAIAVSMRWMVSCVMERLWAAANCLSLVWRASGNDLMTSVAMVAKR